MNENIKSMAYGNGIFIAAAGEWILRSEDGKAWKRVQQIIQTNSSTPNLMTKVIYGNGNFVVCGRESYEFYTTSDNGNSWIKKTYGSPLTGGGAYGNGYFLLGSVGAGGTMKIDGATLQHGWLTNDSMLDIAYEPYTNKFYGIKDSSSNDQGIYQLNEVTENWEKIFNGLPTGGTIRVIVEYDGVLCIGSAGATYQFNPLTNQLSKITSTEGQIIDAYFIGATGFYLTADKLYRGTTEVVTSNEQYVCGCIGPEEKIYLYSENNGVGSITTYPEEETYDIKSIAYGNGVYIAAAVDKILKSTDGENWTVCKTVSGTGHELNKVLYGDGAFLVYGQSYYYLSSDAGVTWTEKASASYLRSAAYGGGYFWMCTPLGGLVKINRTTFENTWLNNESMGDIAYWDGKLFGVKWNKTDQGVYIFVESDNTWFENIVNLPQGDSSRTLRSAGGRLFVGNNAATLEVAKSPTGSYSLQSTAIAGKMVDACEFGVKAYILTADKLYENTSAVAAAISGNYICCYLGGDGKVHMLSSAGVYSDFTPSPDDIGFSISSVVYGNGIYMAAAGDYIIKSTDCSNWIIVKQRDMSISYNHMNKIVYGAGRFLVCGESYRYITSDNGVTWTQGQTASYMDSAAFGEGKFLLSSAVHPGTMYVNAQTFAVTWVDYSASMSDLAYWNGQFFGVKNSTADKNIYTLNLATNHWIAHTVNFPELTTTGKTLRVADDELYIGFNNTTCQVFETENADTEKRISLLSLVGGRMVDACVLQSNYYILTSNALYENLYQVKTFSNPAIMMITAGEELMIYQENSSSGSGESTTDSYTPGSVPPPPKPVYNKTGKTSFTVITDTHGYPWGTRYADFDLGDNTTSTATAWYDPIDTTYADIILCGNHDTAEQGQYYGDVQIKDYDDVKVCVFGLDSASGYHNFVIPPQQIIKMASHMQSLEPNWDIIVLTHVPLFDGNENTYGKCWKEEAPSLSKDVIELLKAFNNHSSFTFSNFNGKTFRFSSSNGYVIGCFAGHVHNQIEVGRSVKGIYMQTFSANGASEWTTDDNNNPGLYEPESNRIDINFGLKTVNTHSYDPKVSDGIITINHVPTPTSYGNDCVGLLKMSASGSSVPKFYYNPSDSEHHGIYLGYYDPSKNKHINGATGDWTLDIPSIKDGTNNISASFIRFTAGGLLKYYSTSKNGTSKTFNSTSVSFVSNNMKWRFQNGKYQFDLAKHYKFRATKSGETAYYPVFDFDGRYLGWSTSAGGYLTGVRNDKDSSSLIWYFGHNNASINVNIGGYSIGNISAVVFDGVGNLSYFLQPRGGHYDSVSGNVEFTTNEGVVWNFSNRKLSSSPYKISIDDGYYNCTKELMQFTGEKYYMKFEYGYLTVYYTNDSNSNVPHTDDIDDANGWTCNRTVYYYHSKQEAYSNQYYDESYETKLYFREKPGYGYYITGLKTSQAGKYAQINGYYFYSDGTNGWRKINMKRK